MRFGRVEREAFGWGGDRRVRIQAKSREGVILLFVGMTLVLALSMLAMVTDLAVKMGQVRHGQTIADSCALVAARTYMKTGKATQARYDAIQLAAQHPQVEVLTSADVRIPPLVGNYEGKENYIEVIVRQPRSQFFGFLVRNASGEKVVSRSVAGFVAMPSGDGVCALNPTAVPGLSVAGQGRLFVAGRIVVNSEGGGLDENGQQVITGNNGVAVSAGNSTDNGIFAADMSVVGGVDNPSNIKPYDPTLLTPLRAGQLPEPDPMLELPTPTIALGVDSRLRGSPKITNINVQGMNTDKGNQNRIATAGESIAGGLYTAVAGAAILHPGIYDDISITGGTVYFIPGIYVVRPSQNNVEVLKITGGDVKAEGVLFYNSGSTYNATTGWPDANDQDNPMPALDNARFGRVAFNSSVKMSPIDTARFAYSSLYPGAPAVSNKFDGMLFFQRRRSSKEITVTGNSGNSLLSGTLYAKWGAFNLSGQGAYDAQFIAGTVTTSGQGDITITSTGGKKGRAARVFLVE
jgi:hypothetical protein